MSSTEETREIDDDSMTMYCNIIIRNAMFTNTYVSFQNDFASLAKDVKIRQKNQTNILASQKVVIPPDRYWANV